MKAKCELSAWVEKREKGGGEDAWIHSKWKLYVFSEKAVIYTLQWNEQKFEGKYLFYPRLFPRILWSAVPLRAASSVHVIVW